MKRFYDRGAGAERVPLADFVLCGEVVEIRWLIPGLGEWMSLSSIMVGGRELRPRDGRAFYDGLERAWPGQVEVLEGSAG